MTNIAIFASGSGTNAENIIQFFKNHPDIKIDSVWSNKKDAYVLERAHKLDVEALYFTREMFKTPDQMIKDLKKRDIKVIVLAGFLWLVPPRFIEEFQIINIHPALLPAYGGKGMYGAKVHEAVIENCEKESGITIHLVNQEFDRGEPLLQVKCPVLPGDTPDTLAKRIHSLEYRYFPSAIENYIHEQL